MAAQENRAGKRGAKVRREVMERGIQEAETAIVAARLVVGPSRRG